MGPAQLYRAIPSKTQLVMCDESIEQDHRVVKRLTRPMLGFKSFWTARWTIAGIAVLHAIRTGQRVADRAKFQTPAEPFSALVV